ncbi:hypothetical protein SPRG_11833 [Saprolegnia parasitica CBS 223.65]|uniref:Uncharacterized protein n=1 Tax=Saprolegnia parasitica (strain CBS 223.65) TaxID=695850 RepID=A0A067C8U8_SAPPC|nr:hypothetical protein SPRG_11833 [Saprolegnia parasitica CBS 223.65]KDO22986.1 hypothetical protein SPRG_11833 [Saprolegnia parasitica CBS 223.65]|eukprot:XP_012206277.1 hypothetical protein SPRG_11833 [Saprolegnia parasitica CBS 223.65]
MLVQPKPLVARGAAPPATARPKKARSSLPSLSSRKPANQKKKTTAQAPLSPTPLPETVREMATRLLAAPAQGGDSCGSAKVRFNHYNKPFPIHNGVLQWKDVDDAYCFSFVYRGAYMREVQTLFTKVVMRRDAIGDVFVGLVCTEQYEVVVEEDPVAGVGAPGLRISATPFVASSHELPVRSGNRATKLLTDELRQMAPAELGSEKARDLLQRRDLEDVLFA